MSIAQYQKHVLAPSEPVDYSSIVMNSYPPGAIQMEPFVGFKVLCQDTNGYTLPGCQRMRQVDQSLGILYNTGVIIRETNGGMRDGFWVITMPVPRSQLVRQLNNLFNVLNALNQMLGIRATGLVEINASGRCNPMETEACLQRLIIPQPYASMNMTQETTAYRYGNIVRINDEFMCFRTMWNIASGDGRLNQSAFEHIMLLSQLLCSMYK